MPGYEPFLLCDFHVHTDWSDGRLPLRDVIDLYGKTRRFDVIAITDHILMKRDLFARAGRLLSLGRRRYSVTKDRFEAYLEEIDREAARARKLYDLFSVTSLKHFPYVANSDFHKPKHLYSWKTLVRAAKNWDAIASALRANVDIALTLYRQAAWLSGN